MFGPPEKKITIEFKERKKIKNMAALREEYQKDKNRLKA